MERRSFGNAVRVSVLGIGCARVGSINNPVSMREIEAMLKEAVEAGINLFDTADIYGQGDSERILGGILVRNRDRMFVITKVGYEYARYATAVRIAKPLLRLLVKSRPAARDAVLRARADTISQNFCPPRLRRAVEASRRRLGVDELDGLLLHSPPLEILRNVEVDEFLCDLLQKGNAAHVGVSVESLPEVEAALDMSAITMLEVPQAVAVALSGTAVLERIRPRKIGLFVRGILYGPHIDRHGVCSPGEALSKAIAPDFVTAAIVGVSTRQHLHDLLSVIS